MNKDIELFQSLISSKSGTQTRKSSRNLNRYKRLTASQGMNMCKIMGHKIFEIKPVQIKSPLTDSELIFVTYRFAHKKDQSKVSTREKEKIVSMLSGFNFSFKTENWAQIKMINFLYCQTCDKWCTINHEHKKK